MPGGRIPPDGRPPQAKGQGRRAKRHDLERPKTPGLHGSDLQQGDVQAMEQGQRIAPATVQQPAQGAAPVSRSVNPVSRGVNVPDPIQFLGGRQGPEFNMPSEGRTVTNEAAMNWLPLVRRLAAGPGSSGALASAWIKQARELFRRRGSAVIIDLNAIDDGLEAMLDEWE